jgi:alpha-tubulin suppressor-like RCC1 family protein
VGEKAPCAKALSGATAIAADHEHALALLSDGTVVAWGENGSGQLGDGTHTRRTVPVSVCAVGEKAPCAKALSGATAIAAGEDFSLALLKDGTVVAWGENELGQLGNGTTTNSRVPVAVKELSGATAIAAGRRHSLALLNDGTVVAWGENNSGQLGNGTETKSNVPVAVKGLSGASAIAAGDGHSMALLSGSAVKAWGADGRGQLGVGSSAGPEGCGLAGACSKTPVLVCAGSHPGPCGAGEELSGVSAISAGGNHSLALLATRRVRTWGSNSAGQLGDGTSSGPESCVLPCSTVPVEVSKLIDVKGIAGGGQHSLAFGPPPPSVTAVSPSEGALSGGTSVTISGTALEEATSVKFGSAEARSFKVNSENSITAVSPPGSGAVDVTVTTPAGVSSASSADQFKYVHVAGAEPDFGRCAKVEPIIKGKKVEYHGRFKDSNCQKEKKNHKGEYEWKPGAQGSFTSVASGPVLKTAATEITCSSSEAEGEYTGPTTFSVEKLVLSGCKQSPAKTTLESYCQNTKAKNGEIRMNALAGELGFIQLRKGHPKNAKVGVDLKPASGSALASFECGGANEITGEGTGTGAARTLEGSVIGEVKIVNAMTASNEVIYKVEGGGQAPESFQGGVKDTLSMGAEGATLTATEKVTNPGKLEINTRF